MTAIVEALEGKELPPSEWFLVTQEIVDAHARTTGDDDWLHTDVAAATEGPTGGTIAQGTLLLAILTGVQYGTFPQLVSAAEYLLNYGFDRLRFVRPVLTGRRVRSLSRVAAVTTREDGRHVIRLDVRLEVEDDDPRPALVAEWLFLAAPRVPVS